MMEQSMVERVAQVLEPLAWAALGTGDTIAHEIRRTSSLRKARAVLEAMRHPTTRMKSAGATVNSQGFDFAHETYSQMIRAALSKGDER